MAALYNTRKRSSSLAVALALIYAYPPANTSVFAQEMSSLSSSSSGSAVVSADSSGSTTKTTASSTHCDAELLFQKLYVLLPAITQCAEECDYDITTEQLTYPSDSSLDKYCASSNCTRLANELEDAGLPTCTLVVDNTTISVKDFFEEIQEYCVEAFATDSPAAAASAANPSNLNTIALMITITIAALFVSFA